MNSGETTSGGWVRAALRASAYGLMVALLCGWACSEARAGQAGAGRVAVIVGEHAPKVEHYAAKQLCGYLNKLYGIHTEPAVRIPSTEDVLLLVGSPATNAAVARALRENGWPKVSDQGIVLKRARLDGKPALVIGGGSPAATLWAVYELVQRWGVHYMLHGDVLPAKPGHFALPTQDVVKEPVFKLRQVPLINDFAMTTSSWGMAEFRPFIDQLAKLKFNSIYLNILTWQPFVPLRVDGISRNRGCLWFCWHYPITADMPGRFLFGNTKEFWNPDLPPAKPYANFQAAGEKMLHSLIAYAHSRGMKCTLVARPTEFPREFKPLLKGSVLIDQLQKLEIVPGADTPVDDPGLIRLSTAVVQSTVNTYPEIDALAVWSPEFRQWIGEYRQAWERLDAKYKISDTLRLQDILPPDEVHSKSRQVAELKGDIVLSYFYKRLFDQLKVLDGTKRPDLKVSIGSPNRKLYPILPEIYPAGSTAVIGGYYTPSNFLQHRDALREIPARKIPTVLRYVLNDDNIGVVPQLNTRPLYELTQELQRDRWEGFSIVYYLDSDLDPTMAYLAQASWDRSATPQSVDSSLAQAVCGKVCGADLEEVFRDVGRVTNEMNLENEADSLSFPTPDMITKFMKPGRLSAHFAKYREGYRQALVAARRAAREATPRGKRYAEQWVGRLKFGVGYFDCIEAVKRAATAQAAAKKARAANEAEVAKEKQAEAAKYAQQALDTARIMINTYAHVAVDRSDLGAIATMDAYIYRPLKRWAGEMKKPGL